MNIEVLSQLLKENIKLDESRDDIHQYVCKLEDYGWQVSVEAKSESEAVQKIIDNLLSIEESLRPFELELS